MSLYMFQYNPIDLHNFMIEGNAAAKKGSPYNLSNFDNIGDDVVKAGNVA